MQFIRNVMSDARKCTHFATKFRRWWKRSSKFARIVVATLLTAVVIFFVCFVGFETSNAVSAAFRYNSRMQKVKLVERKKSNHNGKSDYKKKACNKNGKRHAGECSKDSLNNFVKKPNFWQYPTGGVYPDFSGVQAADLQVNVSLKEQRVRIILKGKTVYSMIMSSGLDDSTPHGDYRINMRGNHFFNPNEGVGADYWVAFIGTQYLFHSVPTTYNFGEYIPSEGMKLGSPASHGCVRLSVADAKWFYDNIPDGTAVHIGQLFNNVRKQIIANIKRGSSNEDPLFCIYLFSKTILQYAYLEEQN